MRFIGNNHALHFGSVTFVNRATLVHYVTEELVRFGKSEPQQREMVQIINDAVDRMEDELREELKQKRYHQDLHVPPADK